jgi:Chitobiase/beta-hexosaminidase C-terminal domain
VIRHVSRGRTEPLLGERSSASAQSLIRDIEGVVQSSSTRRGFIAGWKSIPGASGYRIDVSTDASFASYVMGYKNLDVGNSTSRAVTGLRPGTTYYYRVQAYGPAGQVIYSNVMSAATQTGAGLMINATFDSSITGNPNSAAIETAINQAIAIYESLFSDPITVNILFRYANTEPDGTPLGTGTVAESLSVLYIVPWTDFITALEADASTTRDARANASLPANPLSANVLPSSANGRAVSLDTPPVAIQGASGGPYDGIVILNSAVSFRFGRPPTAGSFDAMSVAEHEMDEVLGLGSYLNGGGSDLRPQDLFSWSAPGVRNVRASGSRYFSVDSGATDIVGFNQDPAGDFGDWLSSDFCPAPNPLVQDAFGCEGQDPDISAGSPEAINLDVIGYNLVASATPNPTPTPTPTPFGQITNPRPNSVLRSSSVTFSGPAGSAATAYWLFMGDEGPASGNIFSSGPIGFGSSQTVSFTVNNLPTDGRAIYARLWSFVNGSWFQPPQDYVYTAEPFIVLTPVIVPGGGTFRGSVVVNMVTATPGATIFYTTDGSDPTTASNIFTGPFILTGNGAVTLRAIAGKAYVPSSGIATASYTIREGRPRHRHRRRHHH